MRRHWVIGGVVGLSLPAVLGLVLPAIRTRFPSLLRDNRPLDTTGDWLVLSIGISLLLLFAFVSFLWRIVVFPSQVEQQLMSSQTIAAQAQIELLEQAASQSKSSILRLQEQLETQRVQVRALTQPRIEIGIDRAKSADGAQWIRLRVNNPTITPITNCYGRVRSMRELHSNGTHSGAKDEQVLPTAQDGHDFPWQQHAGGIELHRTLPAKATDYLDIAMRHRAGQAFAVAGVHRINNTGQLFQNWFGGMAGPLLYELIIQVGSADSPIQPSYVRLVIDPDKDSAELEELSEESADGYINRP